MRRVSESRAVRAIYLFTVLFFGLMGSGGVIATEPAFDVTEYRGQVVVVDFWASWCAPCRRSFPWWNEMHRKYGDDGLVIVGVNMDAHADKAQEFLDEFPAEFKIVYDPKGDVGKEYGVKAMPTTFVIDRDGEVVAKHLGFKVKKQEEYEQVLKETLDTGKD